MCGNLSHDNTSRLQAEQVLLQMKQQHPEMFMLGLLALLRESTNPYVREFCAVILRQHLLVNSSSPVWGQCSPNARKQLQDGLLFLFKNEPSPVLRRKITDAVAATATRISGKATIDMSTDEHGVSRTALGVKVDPLAAANASVAVPWPELMPTVLSLSNVVEARQSLCDLINKLAEFSPTILHPHLNECKGVIIAGMKDSAMPVSQRDQRSFAFVCCCSRVRGSAADILPACPPCSRLAWLVFVPAFPCCATWRSRIAR